MENKKSRLSELIDKASKANRMEIRVGSHNNILNKLIDERGELIIKWRRVEILIGSEIWNGFDEKQRNLLYKQHQILNEYVLILNERIQLIINTPIGEI